MTLQRWVLFVVTAFFVVLFYVPLGHSDYAGRWGEGTYGIVDKATRHIEEVLPETPAARAGVRAGDELVTEPFSRTGLDAAYPVAGETHTFTFRRPGGTTYSATLTAIPQINFGFWDRVTGILAILPATVFLVVAFILVYFRPGVMSWSFFVFSAGYFSSGPTFEFFRISLPHDALIALTFLLSVVLGSFSVLLLIPFLLRFPGGEVDGWRRSVDRVAWLAIALAFSAYSYEWYRNLATDAALPVAPFLDVALPIGAFVCAAVILAKKIKSSTPQLRERLRFLSVAILISFVAYAVYFVPGVPFAITQLVGYLAALMPITIAYAVFRHRVIDVNFVLNRALGYGVVSVVVIAAVSLLDYFFSTMVSKQHFAVLGELAITVAVGFLLDRINKWVSSLLEVTFFRHRMLAEAHLKRVAEALPFATDEAAVTDGLTDVPASALRLIAAALYRVRDDGKGFSGIATSRDTMMAPSGFDANHLLVRMMQATEKPVWLDEVRHYLDRDNSSVYVIAVPVTVRHSLVAFALYGAHRNGSQIDPEELELLCELAREASRAYDHVEAVRTREQFARLISKPIPEIA